jgi:hypothetical protein
MARPAPIRTLARLARENGLAGDPSTRARLESLAPGCWSTPAAAARRWPDSGALLLRDVAAALAILIALMEELDIATLLETDAGLRHGLLHDLHRRCAPA